MPCGSSSAWYALRCSGSESASTPSKSKTIARTPVIAETLRRIAHQGHAGQNDHTTRRDLSALRGFCGRGRGLVSVFRSAQLFAGADRHFQPVLGRRIRAVVGRVVEAERVERAIEIEIVEAGRGPIELDVAAAVVGLGAVGEIAERHEEPAQVLLARLDERAERERLA